MTLYLWLIPILPGLAALINGLAGDRYLKEKTGLLAAGALILSCLLSILAFISVLSQGAEFHAVDHDYYTWLASGEMYVPFGVYVDQLTTIMMLVVTFVGSIIFVYANGYMCGDPGFARFFTYMPLFAFFMLLLVMGNSLPMLFVGWEGVGLCSYLLIGYYYDKDYAADAGRKAFIVNRIGDFGFLIGMLLLFWYTGSFKFTEIFHAAPTVFVYMGIPVTVITLLLFVGATGKSAQIPLFVWLPDAMAGPTPVSALIHAATMVTAGVYMVTRMNVLFTMAPTTLLIVGAVGGLTAIVAASIALVQREAKKILAYSTVSQLGYMFLALGSGAYIAAIFHLMTHAFFKACLFLGAGSVLHAVHSHTDVDVFEAGGLRKYMPYTRWTFLIATLAIAGIPPLAGFFSKDEILWEAFSGGRVFLWVLGIITAFFTAFYMFRLYNLLFSGEFRGSEETRHHIHESPSLMWIPLVILAIFSVCIGWLNMPLFGYTGFHDYLAPVVGGHHAPAGEEAHEASHTLEWVMAVVSVLVALAGILLARLIYVWAPMLPARLRDTFAAPYELLFNKYSVDEIYQNNIIEPFYGASRAAQKFDDNVIIAGLNALARSVTTLALQFRRIQTGTVPHYALATVGGMVFLMVWLLICY